MKTLTNLLEAMASDPQLTETLASAASLDEAINLANDAGHVATKDELQTFMETQDIELSSEDLAAVTGGSSDGSDMFRTMFNDLFKGATGGGQNSSAAGGQHVPPTGGRSRNQR